MLSGFYRLSIGDRIQTLLDQGFIDARSARLLADGKPLLPGAIADRMIENVVGVFELPFAVAPNFQINQKDYVVPMVVEEPSIVAGVSGAAKLFRHCGGFLVTASESLLIGQIQLGNIVDPDGVIRSLDGEKPMLIDFANSLQPNLRARGGGVQDIELFKHRLPNDEWIVVVHLLVDTCDAMGANAVNTLCEGIAPRIAEVCGASVGLRILSNLADRALVTARGEVTLELLAADGHDAETVRDAIVRANDFASVDPYRAATHNKGIMNGVDAVAIATGNDWRAIEAAAHAFAVRDGAYRSLTNWSVLENGNLSGEISLPLKVGIVGGSLESNPAAKVGLEICGVSSAAELATVIAATGLAQNFAALKALVSDGIQKGHMSLHARSVGVAAGVPNQFFDQVVAEMISSGDVKTWKAEALVKEFSASAAGLTTNPSANAANGVASGKVILLGEHAVVYGHHALALPLSNAVTASVSESSQQVELSVPGWNIFDQWNSAAQAPVGAASVVALIMQELGVSDRYFDIQVSAQIPLGMGLGSSAAFAVAVIRAFDVLLKLHKTDEEVDQIAFLCEHITHGTPSGIDNNLATFGRPILFSNGAKKQAETVKLTDAPPLIVAVSGSRGATKVQVDRVRQRYDRNPALYSALFAEIDEISIAGAAALKKGDYEQLGALMNVCHGLLNALEVSTPELEKMIDIARVAGAAGAKLTGAGGGGSIVALCPGKIEEVAHALRHAGYQVIETG